MYGFGRWTTKKAVLKNWCFWIVVLEKPLKSLLDSKGIKTVNSKGKQSWIYIGRTDAEPEAAILWPLCVNYWLIGKDPDARKDWEKGEKGVTEDEIVRWHHWLNGHEFDQTPGNSEGQESLVCCSPWGCGWKIAVHDSVTEQGQQYQQLFVFCEKNDLKWNQDGGENREIYEIKYWSLVIAITLS